MKKLRDQQDQASLTHLAGESGDSIGAEELDHLSETGTNGQWYPEGGHPKEVRTRHMKKRSYRFCWKGEENETALASPFLPHFNVPPMPLIG